MTVAALAGHEFTVCFEQHELQLHRRCEVFPADPSRVRPYPLQDFERIVGVLQRAGLAFTCADPAWFQGPFQLSPGVVSGPPRDRAHLIEEFALVLLGRSLVLLRELFCDLVSGAHR